METRTSEVGFIFTPEASGCHVCVRRRVSGVDDLTLPPVFSFWSLSIEVLVKQESPFTQQNQEMEMKGGGAEVSS